MKGALPMREKLLNAAALKRDIPAVFLALRAKETPLPAKLLAALTVCYALSPIPPVLLITTIASNFVTETGVGLITFFNVLGFVWAGLLLVSGVMVTHDYSFGKNIATLLGTIVSMVVIMFAAVLFTSLVGKMVNFISTIVTEISYRV